MRMYEVTVVTAADGSATAYSPVLRGKLESISYVKDGSNGYTDGVDFTISDEKTGEQHWRQDNVNASTVLRPRAATHTQAGAAALYASGGVAVLAPIAINARAKIVLAAGGNAKTGKFIFHVS